MRTLGCFIETLKRLSFENGDTYSTKDEIYDYMLNVFKIDLYDRFDFYERILKNNYLIKVKDNRYYLYEMYHDEKTIADNLYRRVKEEPIPIKNIDNKGEITINLVISPYFFIN